MMLTLICSKCKKNVKGSASSGAVLAKKRGWKIRDGLMFCPDCAEKKKGKKRQQGKHVVFDGFKFQSESEYNYYLRLKKRQQAGEIGEITVHPPFTINEPYEDKFGRIWARRRLSFDFMYQDLKTGQIIVDDVKGVKKSTGEAVHQERAALLLPLVQRMNPDLFFRWCDEFGNALPLPGTLKKLPKGTGQKRLL